MSASDHSTNSRADQRTLGGALARFLLLGGANTAVTALAFYALSFVMDASLAFTVVYFCGLAFVTFATPRFVFGARPPRARRAALALWYVVVYACGLGMTAFLDHGASAPRELVVLGTLAVTAPLGFLGARAICTVRA